MIRILLSIECNGCGALFDEGLWTSRYHPIPRRMIKGMLRELNESHFSAIAAGMPGRQWTETIAGSNQRGHYCPSCQDVAARASLTEPTMAKTKGPGNAQA